MSQETVEGACHCGKVRFNVTLPEQFTITRCNCSICRMSGFLHVFVNHGDVTFLNGEDSLTEYRFNTRTARHLFCETCGVKPLYVPRSHPDGWSVNAHCLPQDIVGKMTIKDFDGANWEENIKSLV